MSKEKVIRIIEEELGINDIKDTDQLIEVGCNSISIVKIEWRLSQVFHAEILLNNKYLAMTVQDVITVVENETRREIDKINPVPEQEWYQASPSQKQMYALYQMNQDSVSYNIPQVLKIDGRLNVKQIEASIQNLIMRHEILRTTYHMRGEQLVQKVHNHYNFELDYQENSHAITEEMKAFIRPFDLSRLPMIHTKLIRQSDTGYLLLIDIPHIAFDGFSNKILLSEFWKLYNGEQLRAQVIQYKDYALWQNDKLNNGGMISQEEYWCKKFQDEVPLLGLSTDYIRPVRQSFEGDSFTALISIDETKQLKALAKKNNVTMYMLLLSAFTILLSKHSGQDDIVIGTPISGRTHSEIENVVGMFVNTLAMRNHPSSGKSFIEYLKEVKTNCLEAYANQEYPFQTLVEKLNIPRDLSRNPIFDIMFIYQNIDQNLYGLPDMKCDDYHMECKSSKFDLTLEAMEYRGEIKLRWEYSTKLFSKNTVQLFAKHFLQLLQEVCNKSDKKISEINIMAEEEQEIVGKQFNDTYKEFVCNKTVIDLFEEQAAKTPYNIAAIFQKEEITYQELNKRANYLAKELRKQGVKPNDFVAIIAFRNIEFIVGIYGIIKSGAAYVPIDPNYPEDRMSYILSDCNPSIVLIGNEQIAKRIKNSGRLFFVLDDVKFKSGKEQNLPRVNTVKDIAYVIYTSGTTGQPKGVMIQHEGLVNRILWMNDKYPLGERDAILQKTTYTFDVSVWEILWWSFTGARVILLQPGEEKLPIAIVNSIDSYQVTTLHFVPSMLDIFLDYLKSEPQEIKKLSSLKYVFSSGEELKIKSLRNFNNFIRKEHQDTRLINLYGPTEASIDVTYFDCEYDYDKLPIGKPIANTQIYIMNENRMCGIGVPGELCIAGIGLAKGYLNRETLTNERFTDNPFGKGKLYHTGDLAKWLPDGNIDYLGRIDNQVKIRGFRIELGEIESRLREHESISDAVVLADKDELGNPYLGGYIMADKQITVQSIKAHLVKYLPDYMVPEQFVLIDEIPVNSNGKLDRRKLLSMQNEIESGSIYAEPENEIEEKLLEIWSEILGRKRISINDSFFNIGGHSMKAIVMLAAISRECGKNITLEQLFQYPTIQSLANFMESLQLSVHEGIPCAEEAGWYPVSSAQERMYLLHQLDNGGITYNVPIILRIEGLFDVSKAQEAFRELIQKHEILRTVYQMDDNQIRQKIMDSIEFEIKHMEYIKDLNEIIYDFITPFDLTMAPMVHAGIIEEAEDKYILIIDIHHIATDGVTGTILMEDFWNLYQGKKLPKSKLQYKDYAVWQHTQKKVEALKIQEAYWKRMFAGDIPVLNLFTDFSRPIVQSYEGNSLSVGLNNTLCEELHALARQYDVTMFMLMFAAFNILLAKHAGQEDLIVGIPIAGRSNGDTEQIAGVFVNTLALRSQPYKDKSFHQYLSEIRQLSLDAFKNQDYPFEELLKQADITRDMGRNPLFDVMFSYVENEFMTRNCDGLKVSSYPVKNHTSKFDLSLDVCEKNGIMELTFEYATQLYKEKTIKVIASHLLQILEGICKNSAQLISEIELMTEQEVNRILYEFNQTNIAYNSRESIIELFELQAAKHPEKVAIICQDNTITYNELNSKANEVAQQLIRCNTKANDFIAVIMERRIETFIAILAVLKSGAAYVPIDITMPHKRIQFILDDCKAKVILGDGNVICPDIRIPYINMIKQDFSELSNQNPGIKSSLQDIFYLIYTSGTTGNPKGVMAEHRNVLDYVHTFSRKFHVDEDTRVLQQATIAFDTSVEELYPALINGGTIIIVPQEIQLDIDKVCTYIKKKKVNLISCSPLMLNELNQKEILHSVDTFIAGGDVLKKEYINHLLSYSKVYNTYGPTEATVCCTYYEVPKDLSHRSAIPIGKPITNKKVYILDGVHVCGYGIPGELCIAGEGITRGYLNQGELTKVKFVDNPFGEGMLYRTGDLARWDLDGNIEFLGRIDQQFKIRGYRIEAGEIESKLCSYERIRDAVVVQNQDKKGENYLCAYVSAITKLTIEEVANYLNKLLPKYMIPEKFYQIDEIPVTLNGKTDYKKLLKTAKDMESRSLFTFPQNNVEESILTIWQEVLGRERISTTEDFFILGGQSLKAIQLASKVSKKFNKKVTMEQIFRNPTIQSLSKELQNMKGIKYQGIKKATKREWYPVSSEQKRMYALYNLGEGSINYNVPEIKRMGGTLEYDRVEACIKELINRHQILRTSYHLVNHEIVQKIHDEFEFHLENLESNQDVNDILNEFIRPFNLNSAPLVHAGVLKESEESYLLLLDIPHIATDGVSSNILWSEYSKLYNGEKLPRQELQYTDYAVWQKEKMERNAIMQQKEYWKSILGDEIPMLSLPTDYKRTVLQSHRGANLRFDISCKQTKELQELAAHSDVTMYMLILSVFIILLTKHSGQEDILVGTPIAGRNYEELETMVGMFVNTLVIRSYPKNSMNYVVFLEEIKSAVLGAFSNGEYQFEELVEDLSFRRESDRNPIFDVMFSYQSADIKTDTDEKIKITGNGVYSKTSKFDLTLIAWEENEKLNFNFEYCTDLFKEETIHVFSEHLKKILLEICEDSNKKLSEIELMTDRERNQVLYEFNHTFSEYESEATIHQLFLEQVKAHPQQIAITCNETSITYEELNYQADRVASKLRKMGVKPSEPVGVMCEKGIEMIIGILGILKAGGAYVPIDITYPVERISYILADSNPLAVVTKGASIPKGLQVPQIDLSNIRKIQDDYFENKEHHVTSELYQLANMKEYGTFYNLTESAGADSIAYIIYTSGSSGKPKGTLIKHKNAIRLVRNTNYYNFKQCRMLQAASISFDASAFEIWGPLLNGGSLDIVTTKELLNTEVLKNHIVCNELNIMLLTTMLFNNLVTMDVSIFDSVACILIGGEKISETHVELLKNHNPKIRIINAYGPTENGTITSTYEIDKIEQKKELPIGKPIANTTVYVVRDNRICGIGIPGELCVAGDGLASGYLKQPELTQEKFTEIPDVKVRIYKTGDLSRWLPDGNLEFLGRMDQQIKIRGYRIELGEIENRLLQNDNIKNAVVLCKQDEKSDNYLCGYLVFKKDISTKELRNFLALTLPEYMIPSEFCRVNMIPTTSNGKIDKSKLVEIAEVIESGNSFAEPKNETEQKLLTLWQELFHRKNISTTDNFFALGGNSLNAIVLISKMRTEFKKEVQIEQIFENPTICGIAMKLGGIESAVFEGIPKVGCSEWYKTSHAQKRMYILYQMEKGSTNYNVPKIVRIYGNLNVDKIESCIRKLINRHQILRSSYHIVDNEIVQKVHEEFEFQLENLESNRNLQDVIGDFIRPFDLSTVPVVHAGVLKESEESYLLMIDIPHIATDGTSNVIFWNDFWSLYDGKDMKESSIQYVDYAEWEHCEANKLNRMRQKEFWIKKLSGEIPVLQMIPDYKRPKVRSFEGENIAFEVSSAVTKQLTLLAERTGTTMYMILLAAVNVMFSKYTAQEDIIIGTPVAGRNHTDLQDIIGMFVNTLAMRNQPKPNMQFEEFLQGVKTNTLEAFSNQNYPFEELIENIGFQKDSSRNPLFDVMFVYQNMDYMKEMVFSHKVEEIQMDMNFSKFDLTIISTKREEQLQFAVEYCTKIYSRQAMEYLINHFAEILQQIAADSTKKISEIDMITQEEKDRILKEFNNTKDYYDTTETVPDLFMKKVLRHGHMTAIIEGSNSISYHKLNRMTNGLARRLKDQGIKHHDIIGIYTQKSSYTIISMIAAMKVGATYLLIDERTPTERIQFMLKDAGCSMVLTYKTTMELNEVKCLSLEEEIVETEEELQFVSQPDDICYIIYTSGSTGNPKGVMVTQKNVVNYCSSSKQSIYGRLYENGVKTIVSVTTPAFDIFVTETILPLLHGMTIVIADTLQETSGKAFAVLMENTNIDAIQTTPSRIKLYLEEEEFVQGIRHLKVITVGGEAMDEEFARRIHTLTEAKLINAYGPTETTVAATIYEVPQKLPGIIPIGKPLSNTQIYILNESELCGIGVPGELCIAGDGVSKGYFEKQEMTTEKFVDNPYGVNKLYRTGDYARWLPDGNIEFLGRLDNQVKVRGIRIELEEIEAVLLRHSLIKEAVVLLNKKNNESTLCAYIVTDGKLKTSELKGYLAETLPYYMIPERFLQVLEIPLTMNGKIDQRKLLQMGRELEVGTVFAYPENDRQARLLAIWEKLLNRSNISVSEDFYMSGGNSIRTILLASKIAKEFDVEVSAIDIMKYTTIQKLDEYISLASKLNYRNPVSDNVVLLKECKNTDKKLFMIHDVSGEVAGYLEICEHLDMDINVYGIQSSIGTLIPQHITIEEMAGDYLQVINQIQPEGDIILAGWSAGGLLALEIALQAEQSGRHINQILFFDTYMIKDDGDTGNDIELCISDINQQDIFYKAVNGSAIEDKNELIQKINVARNISYACSGYLPHEKIHTNAIYYKAMKGAESINLPIEDYIDGTIKIYEIPGDHFTMMSGNNARIIAESFKKYANN